MVRSTHRWENRQCSKKSLPEAIGLGPTRPSVKKDWVNPEWFFDPLYEDEAVKVCNDCPVRDACLKHALDQPEIFGVWGGMNERDRRKLLARRARMVHMSREHKPHW